MTKTKKGGEIIEAMKNAAPPRPPPPDEDDMLASCPVAPLGHRGGVFYYLSPKGELRAVEDRAHRRLVIKSLFDGDLTWLESRFPVFDKEGVPKPGSWSDDKASTWLMKECAKKAGLFNPTRSVRGPGVWLAPDDGLIVHAGDEILVDGEWRPAGICLDGIIYPAAPRETRPAAKPASAGDAQDLIDLLECWAWRSPAEAPRLLLGWIGQGYVLGALEWRSHIWIAGDRVSGKTENAKLVLGMLGSLLLHASEATPAGVRQQLAGASRPVALDEMETEPSNNHARDIVHLARLGSTEGQGSVLRGSPEGKAQAWPIRAGFYFSSILYPAFLPQDAGRICVLELDKLQADSEATKQVIEARKHFTALGPAFYARMIEGWPRLFQNLAAFDAAIAALGRRVRVRDQVGTLLACAETLLSDEPIDQTAADDLVRGMDIAAIADKHPEEDHELCVNHLMSSAPEWRAGRHETIGEILEQAHSEMGEEARKALKAQGLKLLDTNFRDWHGSERAMWLAVANHHQGLKRIFVDTRWKDGVWAQALKRVPAARSAPRPLDFAGAVSRAVLLPLMVVENGGEDSRRALSV